MAEKPDWEGECRRAVVCGNAEAMRRAVALGMPLNEVCLHSAYTPLHYAVLDKARSEVIAVLLQAGADVNVRTAGGAVHGGQTALMIAADTGRLRVVKQLLPAIPGPVRRPT
jgi:hypothetical protein